MEARNATTAALAAVLLVQSFVGRATAEWTPASPPGCPARPEDPSAARGLAGDMFSLANERNAAGDYEGAATLYTCSYSIVPHPNTLYNLALALEAAGQLREARDAVALYLRKAPHAINQQAAEMLLAELQRKIEASGGLPPGPRALAGVAAGVEADAGGLSERALAGWSLLGTGVALAAGGGTAFAVLADQERSLVLHPVEGTPWRDLAQHRDAYGLYRDLEIIFFVFGGAAVATGAVLLFLDLGEAQESPSVGIPQPLVGPGFVGLGWSGRFDGF